jgi:hypothetical protein
MFDNDDLFLVKTFEDIVQSLPAELILAAKANGSYYDFHIKTDEHIIVPKAINFTFKYVHLIKEHDPEYWEKLLLGWKHIISPMFGDPLDDTNRHRINAVFDNIYSQDIYGIMPPLEYATDEFLYFSNLEKVAKPVTMSAMSAHRFLKLYSNPVEHMWNEHVKTYIFPVNNVRFYGIVNDKLVLLYPKWNAHRWSPELPKFIIDTRDLNKIIKFHPFNIDEEQNTIRIMNGSAKKEVFR